MAQMKTYSRKARLLDSSQGAYNSSQESFFDSPDDPYCFDSQHSAGHAHPQQSIDDRSTLLSSSSDRSATGAFSSHSQLPSTLPTASIVGKTAAPLPNKHARLASQAQPAPSAKHLNAKQAQSASLSRLSQSSSVGAKPASALAAKQRKRSSAALCPAAATVEGPAPKKARLKRSSSSSINQARNSGSSSGRDKPQQAPATTVLEAQESGEHTQIVDDIVYAVDGLGPASSKTSWQDNASTLAEICNTRRGRQAFRIEGLFKEAMTAALQLPLHTECSTAMAFAAMLLSFASGDVANRALLATTEAVQLASQLLQVHTTMQACPASQVKLAKVCRNGAMSSLVAKHPDPSPSLVVTYALSVALQPDKSSLAAEKLKDSLRAEGGLEQLVYAAQHYATQGQATVTSADAVTKTFADNRAPSAFNQCLTVLEHASFACPANEQHLVELSMQAIARNSCQAVSQANSLGHQSSAAESFPTWLVQQIQQMSSLFGLSQDNRQQPDWVCIQSALSVLINMTHNNPAGCQAVVVAGGMRMALRLVSSSMQIQQCDSVMSPGHLKLQDRNHVLTDVGLITAALGLLINLVEESDESRQLMKGMQLEHSGSDADTLQLLCRLMQASASSQRSSMSPSPCLSSGEVTEQHLDDEEAEGAASIVEVYSALLFGFLLANDDVMQTAAIGKLGSLQPVITAIKKCLSFYVDAGAITTQNEESLRKLLASLPACA